MATWYDIVGDVGAGVTSTLEPDPTLLDRVRGRISARARDGAYVAEVHRAVTAEVDPVLAVRVDSISERAEADHRRLTGDRPRLTIPRWRGRLEHALLAAVLVPAAVIVAIVRYDYDAPTWLTTAAWVLLGLLVATALGLDRLEKRRVARIEHDAKILARMYEQMEKAELRTERELETLFAQVPPSRATQARAMELALLREGYDSGRVSPQHVRDALPIIAWHWPTAR